MVSSGTHTTIYQLLISGLEVCIFAEKDMLSINQLAAILTAKLYMQVFHCW